MSVDATLIERIFDDKFTRYTDMNYAAVIGAVREGARRGWSDGQIGWKLGYSDGAVFKIRKRKGIAPGCPAGTGRRHIDVPSCGRDSAWRP